MANEFFTSLVPVTTKDDRAAMDTWLAEQSRAGWEPVSISSLRVENGGSAALVVLRRMSPHPN